MRCRFAILLFFVGLVACPMPARATPFHVTAALRGPDGLGQFGWAVAALEDRVVVGAESGCGGAFLFDAASGALVRSLGEGLGCSGTFGSVLAAGGRWVAVSAWFQQRVYVFDADGELQRTLSLPDADAFSDNSDFGRSLAINDTVAVVGGARTGVYVFDISTGELRFRIDDPAAGPYAFGAAVAFTGGRVFVADPAAGIVRGFDGVSGLGVWGFGVRLGANRALVLAADAGRVAVGGGLDAKGRDIVVVLDATTAEVLQRYRVPRRREIQFGTALALQDKSLLVGAFTRDDTAVVRLYHLGRRRRVTAFQVGSLAFRSLLPGWLAFAGDRLVVGTPGDKLVTIFERE